MGREHDGKLRHPAGSPKSIGGQYAPDVSRGGAAAAPHSNGVATTGTVRWQMYDDRGDITHEFGESSFDIHAVLDEMDLEILADTESGEAEEIAFDDLADDILYRAQKLGVAPEPPMEGLAFAFSVDQEELQRYVDQRIDIGQLAGSPNVTVGEDLVDPADDYNTPAPVRGVIRARRTLENYGAVSGDLERNQTAVQDALTDLLHFADQEGVDVNHAYLQAVIMRDAEVTDPET